MSFSQKENTNTAHLELVAYFHDKAGHPSSRTPTKKELGQARELLTLHGPETSRQIVDYALAKAAFTNFSVQHFGAVLLYVPAALEHLKQSQVRRDREEADRRRRHEEQRTFENARPNLEGLLKLKIGRFRLDKRREPTAVEIEQLRRQLAADIHP